jgi:hypothetical protein
MILKFGADIEASINRIKFEFHEARLAAEAERVSHS